MYVGLLTWSVSVENWRQNYHENCQYTQVKIPVRHGGNSHISDIIFFLLIYRLRNREITYKYIYIFFLQQISSRFRKILRKKFDGARSGAPDAEHARDPTKLFH